jgi:hypothetical protein
VHGEIIDGAVRGWLEGPPGHWVDELGTLASDDGFDGLLLWSKQIAGFAGAGVARTLKLGCARRGWRTAAG